MVTRPTHDGAASAPRSLRAALGADARCAATAAAWGAAVFAAGETVLTLARYVGPVALATKARLLALAVTLAALLGLGLGALLFVLAAAPRLLAAVGGDRRAAAARPCWLAPPPPTDDVRPQVARVLSAFLAATVFVVATQRAQVVLTLYVRERQLAGVAVALAALALGGAALALHRGARALLLAGQRRLRRLGAANALGRWRAAAALIWSATSMVLGVAWERSPQLRAVFSVPWWTALPLVAAGVSWGLVRHARGAAPLIAGPRRAVVGAALLVVTAATLWRWGGDTRTKYVAVTASPPFDRLIALVRVVSDLDRDGYGSLLGENDCAPLDRAVRPFAVDAPDNGIDENCDGHDFSLRDLPAPTGPRPGVPPAFKRPWNVLLVTIDTVRYDRTSFGGYRDGPRRRDTTPRLAELVNRSVSFTQAAAPSAGTMASIPALMTSKFFHSGIALDENVPPRHPPRVAPENLTLPEVMKQAGYRTGVVASHDYWNDWGLDQGVDDYDNSIGAKPNPFLIAADRVTDHSLAWISRQGEARWFLWAHYIDPHGRYVAHPDVVDWGSSEPDLYDAELRWTDRELGRLLAELGRLPGGDRTIVIVTSDHGDSMGEHGVPLGTHGTALYQELLHVPLIFYLPDNPPKQVAGAVSVLDIFPTLVDLLDLPARDALLEGQSLVPQLFYGQPDLERIVFAETNAPTPQRAAIGSRHKLIYYLKNNVYELFDLVADPGERQNLAPTAPPELARLRGALDAWLERVMYARDPRFNQAVSKLRDVLLREAPRPAMVTAAPLDGGRLRVVGVDARRAAHGALELELFYQVMAQPTAQLGLGVEVATPGAGALAAAPPRVPSDGVFPPERWRPGEWIRDRFTIPVPPQSTGPFELTAITSAGERVTLGIAPPLPP